MAPPRLADHIVAFVRALRSAGLRAGPAQVLDALACVQAVGPARREDFYWALHAALIRSPHARALFDAAFDAFFGDARPGDVPSAPAPSAAPARAPSAPPPARLLAGARSEPAVGAESRASAVADARLTSSADEVLAQRDFARMSGDELARARAAIARLVRALPRRPSRRRVPAGAGGVGRLDLRRTLRASRRHGGEPLQLARTRRRSRLVPIVLLCDVSGSMAAYSRMWLHFAHALSAARGGDVHTFVFATRLSHVTRALADPDPDAAVARVAAQVQDLAGGTRIAECLREFNDRWARRLLCPRATVVLLSDGLERHLASLLGDEAARLARSAGRVLWLNPLLRYPGFEPRAAGIRALLPHVSALRPAHDLASLRDLAEALLEG